MDRHKLKIKKKKMYLANTLTSLKQGYFSIIEILLQIWIYI